MALDVIPTQITKTLWQLDIYDGQTKLGEYERSVEGQINRKKREISSAEMFLRRIHQKHGPFQVRWDGSRRVKSVRVNGREIDTIPEDLWSWA